MKKKIRLFIALIVLAAIGLTLVLGAWLVEGYKKNRENITLIGEKSLFNAVQQQTLQYKKQEQRGLPAQTKAEIKKRYELKNEKLDLEEIYALLDSSIKSPPRPHPGPYGYKKMQHGREKIAPPILLPLFGENINLDDKKDSLQLIEAFRHNLSNYGIESSFSFYFRKFDDTQPPPIDHPRNLSASSIPIRPFLVNPETNTFLLIEMDLPWTYLIKTMAAQIVLSFLVMLLVLGSLIYLLDTLWKQYRLDIMRKSFIHSLTHELRTPITTVYAALDSMRSHVNDQDRDIREIYYNMAFEELEHLNSMINKVLDIAEGEQEHMKSLQFRPLDIGHMIKETVRHIQLTNSEGQISILCDVPSYIIFIDADSNHMRSVVNNLLDNAIKYGATKIWVTLEDHVQNDTIQIIVQDNGMGIQDSYQQQVFKPFFRVPQAGDLYPVKGFGLGLSYVKNIVSQHRGQIILKSSIGLGSKFVLVLPKKNNKND